MYLYDSYKIMYLYDSYKNMYLYDSYKNMYLYDSYKNMNRQRTQAIIHFKKRAGGRVKVRARFLK